MSFNNKKIDLIIIILSALTMVIILNLPFKAKPFGDLTFHQESKNLALYIKGEKHFNEVTITKAPGPILFYTIPYIFAPSDSTDNDYWNYGVIFTSLFMTLSLLIIYRTTKHFFSKEVAILSIILFFIFPIHCYYTLGIMAEAPAFFSLALSLYGWSKIDNDNTKYTGWILFILGTSFLILNRPNTLLLLCLSFIIIFYSFYKKNDFFKLFGKKLTIALICIGSLGIFTLNTSKQITHKKTNMNQNKLLYYVAHQGRFQFRNEPFDFRFWDNDIRGDSKDYQDWVINSRKLSKQIKNSNSTYEEVYKSFLINDLIQHPGLFIRQFFIKCFYGHIYVINSIKPENFKLGPIRGSTGYYVFLALVNSINVLILIGALIFLIKEPDLIRYWLFWSILVALLIFHGLTYMEPRYLFPSRVALYMISAAGLCRIKLINRVISKITKVVS